MHGEYRAKDENEMDRVLQSKAVRQPLVRLWSIDPHAVSAREYNHTPDSHSMSRTTARVEVIGSVSLQTLLGLESEALEKADVECKEPIPT